MNLECSISDLYINDSFEEQMVLGGCKYVISCDFRDIVEQELLRFLGRGEGKDHDNKRLNLRLWVEEKYMPNDD